ncbi:Zn-dependent hydrolase [Corticibacter populi]|uniref:Zn-dependent hydrolase n=1 Tax=Corticibacter populi TaxID=1550736 RepID=A0A3M6QP29_9BURK|nr:M20 family metallo-hydrolase [Corticibacter populi]RMX04279.1 Zn-dependent hydrolase [Corticibacter populi]RZS33324.1 N-carbamoyl-L-amino-acid hydrolase [Corticibacter populi]
MNQPLSRSAEQAQDAIDNERLQSSIAALATFGGRPDGGVSRETLTSIDLASRHYLIEQARALGCEVMVDDCANLFFRRAGRRNELPPVLTGSHGDTQPVGGKLDGAYGVVAGLEIIAALNDAGIDTLRPIEVVAWTNEEGSRFGPGTMGSSAFVDPSRLAGYLDAVDQSRVRFGDALQAALDSIPGVPRCEMQRPLSACVELHIEQGPVLERAGIPLGVVTGIQAVRWFTVTCHGAMAHAGTTPMDERRDAMAAAVSLAQKLYGFAATHAADQLRLTLGRWQVSPNSVNTIPGQVEFTVDVRCLDDSVLDRFEAFLRGLAADAGGSVSLERFFQRAPTHFPRPMLDLIQAAAGRACAQAGLPAPMPITSGAFHDAMYLADHCPTAMIFVPSKNGISHNAAEATDPHDLFLGVQALAYTVTALANQET